MKKIIKTISIMLTLALVIGCFASCSSNKNETTTAAGDTTAANVSADKVKTIDISLTDELYAFGVSKDDAELLKSVNEYIAKIKSDGTLDKIMNNYFGDGTPVPVTSAAVDSTKDQLLVATNAEFPPFESTEGTNYIGVDMEICKGLADTLGKELVIVNIDFDSVLATVESGNADMAASGLTITEARKQQVTFSDSYYTASQYLIVPADCKDFDACTTKEDVDAVLAKLTDKNAIGVQNATTAQFYVEGDEDWGFAGLACECKGFSSGALAVTDMLNGNVDYVLIDEAPAQFICASVNGK